MTYDADAERRAIDALTDEAAWDALTSPGGWEGYTCSAPKRQPEDVWHCVLAFIVRLGEETHFWDVMADSDADCRAKAIAAVREWTAEDGRAGAGHAPLWKAGVKGDGDGK